MRICRVAGEEVKGAPVLLLVAFAAVLLSGCVQVKEDCDTLTNQEQRDDCWLTLASEKAKDISTLGEAEAACDQVTSGGALSLADRKDDCYYTIATVRATDNDSVGAIALCGSVQSGQKQRLCYSEIAGILKDPSICDLYVGEGKWFFKQTAIESCRDKAQPPSQIYWCGGGPPFILLMALLLSAVFAFAGGKRK